MDDLEKRELPKVASSVYVECKKCGVERYHKVIAHSTSTSAKITCEVCGSKKTFKIPKVQERKLKRKVSAKKIIETKETHEILYEKLKEELSGQEPQPYSMTQLFKKDMVIKHKKFGIGFVTESYGQKISVVFQESIRDLVHNR